MLHNAFCSERDVWAEIKAVRTDFSTMASAVSQAYGQDFFSYVQKHWQNLEVRRKYKLNTPEGYTLYDSSLKEPWNASLVLAALDKQLRTMGTPSFTSEIDELYTRPLVDIVVEEFISNLPGPTVEEVDEPMEQAGGSDAAPADSPSGEMAGEAKQVEEPERTTFPPTAAPDDVRMDEASESGDHATGSSPSGEVPMPDMNFSADAPNHHDNLYEQGIWGKTKTRVEPGAYEAEAKATAEAEEKNEKAFEQFAGEKEKEGLADTIDFMNFHEAYHLTERMSPLMKLSTQVYGYGKVGLYHDDIRLDKINSFKVQHMYFRQK
ncbi:GIP, partial [Symbiodinium necroappetens]